MAPHAFLSIPGSMLQWVRGWIRGGHGILEIGDVDKATSDWPTAPWHWGKRRERPPSHRSLPCIQAAAANFWQGLLYSMLQARLGSAKQPSLGRNCLNACRAGRYRGRGRSRSDRLPMTFILAVPLC